MKCESCGAEHPDWIPKERLSKVTSQRKEAEEARDAALAKVTELEGSMSSMDELRSQLEGLTAERDKLTTRAAIMQAGIVDPEGIEVVEALWGAKPEDARPSEGLAGWLTSPDDLPRAVRAYLPQETAPASPAAPEQPVPAPSTPPPANHRPPGLQGAHTGQPAGQGKLTSEQIANLSQAEYKAWREGGGYQAMKSGR